MTRKNWGISQMVRGAFEELFQEERLDHNTVTHRVFCSCDWDKTIELPHQTQGIWTDTYEWMQSVNFKYDGEYEADSLIAWLCHLKHHWYCYFESIEDRRNRVDGINKIRAVIRFEDRSEAILTRLMYDYDVHGGMPW